MKNKILLIICFLVFTGHAVAYEDGRLRGRLCPITLPATTYTVTAPVLITEDMVCDEAIDSDLATCAQIGGGDVRFVTSTDETTQIPLEVIRFIPHATPASATVLMWVGPITRTAGQTTTIYMAYTMADAIIFSSTQPDAASTYGSQGVWDGYISVWHMEESAPPYRDSAIGANDGAATSAPDRVAGAVGYGQEGDGTNDFISLATTSDYAFGSDNFTVMAFYKPTLVVADSKNMAICQFGGGTGASSNRIGLWYAGSAGGGDSSPLGVITYSGTSKYTPINASANLDDGNWHHAACVRDGNYFRNIIDGVEYGTATSVTGVSVTPVTTQNSLCAASASASGDYIRSKDPIDEIWVYDGALSANTIFEIMTQAKTPSATVGTPIDSNPASSSYANIKSAAGITEWKTLAGIPVADVKTSAGIFLTNTWYVRPDGGSYGTEDGTSYANAFDGSDGINWASISVRDTIYFCGNTPAIIDGQANTIPNGLVIRGDYATEPSAIDGTVTIDNYDWENVSGNIYKVAIRDRDLDYIQEDFPASPTNGQKWFMSGHGSRDPRMSGRALSYNNTTAKWDDTSSWFYAPNSVYVDTARKPVSRYPDPGDGFLIADSYSTYTGLTDATINKADNYWIGTDITITIAQWMWNTRTITDSSAATTSLTYPSLIYSLPNAYGREEYYLTNIPYDMLDEEFEWSYRDEGATAYLYMYLTDPYAQTIKYSSVNYGVFVLNAKYIEIVGFNISKTNDCAILVSRSSGVAIDNCAISDVYPCTYWPVYGAITLTSEQYVHIDGEAYYNSGVNVFPWENGAAITNCTIENVLLGGGGINIFGYQEVYLQGNTITNVNDDDNFPSLRGSGIDMVYIKDVDISGNVISRCGYSGIVGAIKDSTISGNIISDVLTQNGDGAGVYVAQLYTTNNTITANNVENVHCDKFAGYNAAFAYYTDYGTSYTTVDANVACSIIGDAYDYLIFSNTTTYCVYTDNALHADYNTATFGQTGSSGYTESGNTADANACPF